MKRTGFALTLVTLSLAAGVARGEEAIATAGKPDAGRVQTGDLQPFTSFARIPANSDTGSIRFQRAKRVQVPATIAYATNPEYCKELAFRDPGGSMYCSNTRAGSPATAYEVTYSFVGQPLASDEYGSRNFTFKAYFQPDELAPEVRQAISAGKRNRTDVAGYFSVSTHREPVRRIAIDEAQSRFCDGNFRDGAWTATDSNCKDQIGYKAIAALSDYITVSVAPVPARAGLASAITAAKLSSGTK